jgi:hypothetical protein
MAIYEAAYHSLSGVLIDDLRTLSLDYIPAVFQVFEAMHSKWFPLEHPERCHFVLNFTPGDIHSEVEIITVCDRLLSQLLSLNIAFEQLNDSVMVDYGKKFSQMYELLYNVKNFAIYNLHNNFQ